MPCAPYRNWMLALLALLAAWAGAGIGVGAQEVPASPDELPTRAQLQQQRQAVQTQLQAQEAACQQRFAVEDCLRKARSAARAQDNLLWRQELELNEIERRDRAAQRRRTIEAHGGDTAQPPTGQGAEPARQDAPEPAPRAGHDAQLRAWQAGERASQARQRQQAHEAAQQQRAQQQAERLEQSRQRYQARQQRARERQAERARRHAQDAAEGRVPAQPLPPPGD